MSKPIYATPKMSREESRRIYSELKNTTPSDAKAAQFKRADGVFERAQARKKARVVGTGMKH